MAPHFFTFSIALLASLVLALTFPVSMLSRNTAPPLDETLILPDYVIMHIFSYLAKAFNFFLGTAWLFFYFCTQSLQKEDSQATMYFL